MKKVGLIITAAALSAVLYTSCKKTPDYVPVPYKCECGVATWQGTEYPLMNASYILTDSTDALTRRYFITIDLPIEGEDRTHALSMVLEVDDCTETYYNVDIEEGDLEFAAVIDELNVNDQLLNKRTYVPVVGLVQITPALLGGTERVSFNMDIQELYEEELVGFPSKFIGNFTVQIPFD